MKSLKNYIDNLDRDEFGFLCYKFYTNVLNYNWKKINDLEEYKNYKNNLNPLQQNKLAYQKIDLKTGNVIINAFEGLRSFDVLEINDQKDISLLRSCIVYYNFYKPSEEKADTILRHESQTISKLYKSNSYNLEYFYKKSVMTNELIKINANTNEIEESVLLTNKIADIPDHFLGNLPLDFIDLMTNQVITITQISLNIDSPYIVYSIDK